MVADAKPPMIEAAFKTLIEDKVLPADLSEVERARCKSLFFLGMQAVINFTNDYPPIRHRIQAELMDWWEENGGMTP